MSVSNSLPDKKEGGKKLGRYAWKEVTEHGEQMKRMVDCSREELAEYISFCQKMLHNTDPEKKGRSLLLKEANRAIRCCDAILLTRWLKTRYEKNENSIYSTFNEFVANNIVEHPDVRKMRIADVMGNCPSEFDSVTVDDLLLACTDGLPEFHKRNISISLLLDIGIRTTSEERRSLIPNSIERADIVRLADKGLFRAKMRANGDVDIPKTEVAKYRMGIFCMHKTQFNMSGLTMDEIRSILELPKICRYSDISTPILETLRSKVYPRLIARLEKQISAWTKRMNELKEVLAYKDSLKDL